MNVFKVIKSDKYFSSWNLYSLIWQKSERLLHIEPFKLLFRIETFYLELFELLLALIIDFWSLIAVPIKSSTFSILQKRIKLTKFENFHLDFFNFLFEKIENWYVEIMTREAGATITL